MSVEEYERTYAQFQKECDAHWEESDRCGSMAVQLTLKLQMLWGLLTPDEQAQVHTPPQAPECVDGGPER
ncbi:hypothetical protein [Pseudacidovorax sp. RU35E]|uniref:hypothetical protein n=1 Tax=Pseudacidovorax sp. RU35E TaxID=1907403 RepID=UPI000953EA36|nr:hypothetical protein [Pseudacidovorax sp. RU35E]SIQ55405.1 hypothetical protein SAMN05880557_104259 [Pseudacidovorax sp. RU35E]